MDKVNNNKMELIKKLESIENDMLQYRGRLMDKVCKDSMKEALKADLKLCEYRYKVATIELTAEDRDELYEIAREHNINLKHIKALMFDEEEKEDYYKVHSSSDDFPDIPGWDEELAKMNAKISKENPKGKKHGLSKKKHL